VDLHHPETLVQSTGFTQQAGIINPILIGNMPSELGNTAKRRSKFRLNLGFTGSRSTRGNTKLSLTKTWPSLEGTQALVYQDLALSRGNASLGEDT